MVPIAGVILGGLLMVSTAHAQQVTPSFGKEVAPILKRSCTHCHRPGSIGPMALETFDQVRPWARSIRNKVSNREMPPWYIDKRVGIQQFNNDPSLTDAEIETIVKWIDAGAPASDLAAVPAPRQSQGLDDVWQFKPDKIVQLDKDVIVAAQAPDWWTDIVVDPGFTEDRWVKAIETKPSKGMRAVHHAATSVIEPDADGSGLPRGRLLNEYALGKNADIYADGTARLIKAGSKISFNLHLAAVGEETPANVSLALQFYPRGYTPKYPIEFLNVAGSDLDIPPNTDNVRHDSYFTLIKPTRLLSFQPHMHNRGKAMCIEAILPGNGQGNIRQGNEILPISCVDRYQFAWHISYHYAEDVQPLLPAGTVLHITAWHNNTTSNRFNPDPDQHVTFGNRTVDDMGFAWLKLFYMTDEDYQQAVAARQAQPVASN